MILVSVDDRLVEPPHLFKAPPAKFADEAPKVISNDKGDDVWTLTAAPSPTSAPTLSPGTPNTSTAPIPQPSTRCVAVATTSTSG